MYLWHLKYVPVTATIFISRLTLRDLISQDIIDIKACDIWNMYLWLLRCSWVTSCCEGWYHKILLIFKHVIFEICTCDCYDVHELPHAARVDITRYYWYLSMWYLKYVPVTATMFMSYLMLRGLISQDIIDIKACDIWNMYLWLLRCSWVTSCCEGWYHKILLIFKHVIFEICTCDCYDVHELPHAARVDITRYYWHWSMWYLKYVPVTATMFMSRRMLRGLISQDIIDIKACDIWNMYLWQLQCSWVASCCEGWYRWSSRSSWVSWRGRRRSRCGSRARYRRWRPVDSAGHCRTDSAYAPSQTSCDPTHRTQTHPSEEYNK